jgi:putative oxidoreductase
MITVLNIIGQIIFGGYFIYNGIKHLKDHRDYTAYAASQGVPMPGTAVVVSGLLILLGGIGVFFNVFPGISLTLIAIFLIFVTPWMHAFWKAENPAERASLKVAFLKNTALLGACLLLFKGF